MCRMNGRMGGGRKDESHRGVGGPSVLDDHDTGEGISFPTVGGT